MRPLLPSLLSLSLLLLAAVTQAAPAPIPKPPPTHQIEGAFWMTWGIASSEDSPETSVWLSPQGFFADYYRGEQWMGTWSLEGDTLTVTEVAPDGRSLTWTATLDPPRKGKRGATGTLYGGTARFALRE